MLSLQPSKRERYGLNNVVQSKPPRFILKSVIAATTRQIHPLPTPRRFLQPTKPAHPSITPRPAHAQAARAATGRLPGKLTGVRASRQKMTRTHLACEFAIHEDTADEEMGNLLTHWLDISDSESQRNSIGAKRTSRRQTLFACPRLRHGMASSPASQPSLAPSQTCTQCRQSHVQIFSPPRASRCLGSDPLSFQQNPFGHATFL